MQSIQLLSNSNNSEFEGHHSCASLPGRILGAKTLIIGFLHRLEEWMDSSSQEEVIELE